jgi:hypothetical protein
MDDTRDVVGCTTTGSTNTGLLFGIVAAAAATNDDRLVSRLQRFRDDVKLLLPSP